MNLGRSKFSSEKLLKGGGYRKTADSAKMLMVENDDINTYMLIHYGMRSYGYGLGIYIQETPVRAATPSLSMGPLSRMARLLKELAHKRKVIDGVCRAGLEFVGLELELVI